MSREFVWPKVSLVLLTYNGERTIEQTLKSLKKIDYPANKLELIISDNNSKDNTAEVVKKYFKKVFISEAEMYAHRAEAMRRATGEFIFMIMEQDMELKSRRFIQKMVEPLIEDTQLAGSFTREYPKEGQPCVTRFISYDPIQRDPLFEFLTPSIENMIVEKRKGYFVCDYNREEIPPTTHMLFRKSFLKKSGVWSQKKDYDHDTILKLVKSGLGMFAYVPSAGTYHHHAETLGQLIAKRLRNLRNHYFPENKSLSYRWIDMRKPRNLFKLLFWVMYANLIVPAMLRGIFRFFKHRDLALLMEPIITISVTDALLVEFLRDKMGRRILLSSLLSLVPFGKHGR